MRDYKCTANLDGGHNASSIVVTFPVTTKDRAAFDMRLIMERLGYRPSDYQVHTERA